MSLINKSNIGKPKTRLAKAKEKIYFEKQESRLCGQHCLNNALQSPMFDAIQLSEIARELDAKERERMAELGTHTQEYKEFIEKPSANYDDSGYFSVQVLAQALNNLNLEMVPLLSTTDRALAAQKDPVNERLFICNQNDHWLSIRRFGPQWMNLNSTLPEPVPIGNTYLGMLLDTLKREGYSIFAVFGELPLCEAETLFAALPVDEDGKVIDQEIGYKLGSDEASEEEMIRRGIELSLAKSNNEILRARREKFLERLEKSKESNS